VVWVTFVLRVASTGDTSDGRERALVWVLIAVVVVLVVVVGILLARQRRSQQLREGFGPEYDRVLADRGDQRSAEAELAERRERREQFPIRELEPSAREQYLERWRSTQRRFVDEPAVATEEADRLVTEVMHARGYPVDEKFEQRAADVSVDHPGVVDNYRAAHAISLRAQRGNASTEDLRQAMVHFRSLFDELLDPENPAGAKDGSRSPTRPDTARR
jgi:hypothetical protein